MQLTVIHFRKELYLYLQREKEKKKDKANVIKR